MRFKRTTATKKIRSLTKRIRVVQGGTSASKTISILIRLIALAQADAVPTLTSIVSESFPHLRRGAMRDFLNIMKAQHYYKEGSWSRTDYTYTFETGSKIEFFSVDQPDKLRGARRDRLFINEANNIHFEAFEQLEVRTKEFVFIDYNPTNEFWAFTDVEGKRDDSEKLILTYKDNEALDQNIIDSIEARQNRPQWWLVYGLGQLGEVEGKIYTGWQIVDKVPHEARLEKYGLDFGYSCLVGETLITTDVGEKRIDQVRKGDFVLTRSGYKRVLDSWSNGPKDVYGVDFGYGRGIIGTGGHRVFAGGKWVRIDQLSCKEIICEKRLGLMERLIGDTQTESTRSIFSRLMGKVGCIGTFMSRTMEKYLGETTSTTLTGTRLITSPATWLHCHHRGTPKATTMRLKRGWLPSRKKRWQKYGEGSDSERITGEIEGRKAWRRRVRELKGALSVERVLRQLGTHIRSTVGRPVTKEQTQGGVKRSTIVSGVARLLQRLLTTKERHVQRSAHITCRPLKEKREVFDLSVEGEHEFFANGVLVHNCDPTAIIAIYYYNGGYILDEVTYQKGLSNKQIADILLSQDQALVVADSAEPKSIDEIKEHGVLIVGAKKGQGSVNQGIQYVQNQKVSMTKRSVNLIKEYRNYLWETDKSGKVLNKAEKGWDHCLDAVRYGLASHVKKESKDDEYAAAIRQVLSDSVTDLEKDGYQIHDAGEFAMF